MKIFWEIAFLGYACEGLINVNEDLSTYHPSIHHISLPRKQRRSVYVRMDFSYTGWIIWPFIIQRYEEFEQGLIIISPHIETWLEAT